MDADTLLQGFVYAFFSLCGASSLIYCIRMRLQSVRPQMKQSPSMEDLTSIKIDDDPQIV